MILLYFQRVLFLHISPLFPYPRPLALFGPVCGASGTVKRVVPGRGKQPSALPASPLSASKRREQSGAQTSVQREDGGTEPAAHQRIGDTLRTDTFLAVVQKQAIPAIVVTALMHQSPGGAVLLIGHVGDLGRSHFTRSLGKIVKMSNWRF